MISLSLFATITTHILITLTYLCINDTWKTYKTMFGLSVISKHSTNAVAKVVFAAYVYSKLAFIFLTVYHVYLGYNYFTQ